MINNRFTWDFWYLYEPQRKLYHVYCLSADWQYKQTETHHLYSQLTYAITSDFKTFELQEENIIPCSENCSIWTGCTIKIADNDYWMFYTERRTTGNYFAGQTIKLARSPDLKHWIVDNNFSLSPDSIDPEFRYFQRTQKPGDRTPHAWRDPYIFKIENYYYMLVAAKLKPRENTRVNFSACIALLKADESDLKSWTLVHPSLIVGYEELELPQVYRDEHTDEIILRVSTWDERDYQRSAEQGIIYRERGQLLAFEAANIDAALAGTFSPQPQILIGEMGIVQAEIYGCVWIPELKAVVGFDFKRGGYQAIDSELFNLDQNLVYLNSETRQLKEK